MTMYPDESPDTWTFVNLASAKRVSAGPLGDPPKGQDAPHLFRDATTNIEFHNGAVIRVNAHVEDVAKAAAPVVPALPGTELLIGHFRPDAKPDIESWPVVAWRVLPRGPHPVTMNESNLQALGDAVTDGGGEFLMAVRWPNGTICGLTGVRGIWLDLKEWVAAVSTRTPAAPGNMVPVARREPNVDAVQQIYERERLAYISRQVRTTYDYEERRERRDKTGRDKKNRD